jgi:acyl-CoA reductase-like NAD-dependent aldehyde dehydrogenase
MLERILASVKALKIGDPRNPSTDIGPMINQRKAEEAYGKVQEAIKQGAQILTGGTLNGTLFVPTVIVDTKPDMRINREEVFAPVISVAPYDDFGQALRMANAGDSGLQVGVFTQDINRVMRAFRSMDVGGVIVNDIPTFRVDQMPYGGVKGSGIGREGPRYAIEEMTELRLMVINGNGGIDQD